MAEVPALRRAVAILRQLGASNRDITAGALTRGLDLPRSSVYDILGVLEDLGFVVKSGAGYMLGPGVYELGSSYLRANPLQRLAQPIVRKLAEDTGSTTQLAVLRGWETVYVLKERAVSSVGTITAAGLHMPSYLTATGRSIMAYLPKHDVLAALSTETSFVSRTGKGPANLRELNEVLREVRALGYAAESGEITPGIATIAAPVFDAHERSVAAIGMSVPIPSESRDAASEPGSRGTAEPRSRGGSPDLEAPVEGVGSGSGSGDAASATPGSAAHTPEQIAALVRAAKTLSRKLA